jgi:hypothetical protein
MERRWSLNDNHICRACDGSLSWDFLGPREATSKYYLSAVLTKVGESVTTVPSSIHGYQTDSSWRVDIL